MQLNITRFFDESTSPHEFSHGFLREYERLVTTVKDLPQKIYDDWRDLTKWLGISDIDFSKPQEEWTKDQQIRYKNAQEKFAVGAEKYLATGKAPLIWPKGMFSKFKTWLSHVYPAVSNIRYEGTDKREHSIEITPETRRFYDTVFKWLGDMPYVPSETNRQARLALSREVKQDAQGEELHRQSISGQDGRQNLNIQGNAGSSLKLNLPFSPSDLRTEKGNSIDKAHSSELLVTPEGSTALSYIDATTAGAAGIQEGEIQANVGILRHAEQRHGQQLRDAGYENVQTFLLDTLNNWSEIRQGTGNFLWLVAPKNDGHGAVAAVQLHQDKNGTYRVSTLLFARNRVINKKGLLFAGRPSPAPSSGSGMNLARAESVSSEVPAAKGDLSGEQPSRQSLDASGNSVNSIGTQHIRRTNDSLVSQQDIERFDQLVLHGTDHIILGNRFDMRYIGTGAGSQAYGWVIYFAKNPEVAKSYRYYDHKRQRIRITTDDGKTFSADWNNSVDFESGTGEYYQDNWTGSPDNEMKQVLSDFHAKAVSIEAQTGTTPSTEQIKHSLRTEYMRMRQDAISQNDTVTAQIAESHIKALDRISGHHTDKGNMYLADIPENNVLIDWDADIDEQPEEVKKGMRRVIEKARQLGVTPDALERLKKSPTGEHFYRNLEQALMPLVKQRRLKTKKHGTLKRADMAASLILNKAGIPGLRYFDALSRDKKTGTHNFVIWNTDAIKLLGLTADSDTDARQYYLDYARSKRQAEGARNNSKGGETYRQFISEPAAQRLDIADGTPIRTNNLRMAKRLARKDMPAKNIWLATGWIQRPDGQWRHEILDGKLTRPQNPDYRYTEKERTERFNEDIRQDSPLMKKELQIMLKRLNNAPTPEAYIEIAADILDKYYDVMPGELAANLEDKQNEAQEAIDRINGIFDYESEYDSNPAQEETQNENHEGRYYFWDDGEGGLQWVDEEGNLLGYDKDGNPVHTLVSEFYEEYAEEDRAIMSSTYLPDVFDAPELYKAYPQLKSSVYREINLGRGVYGTYSPNSNTSSGFFTVNRSLNDSQARSVLIYEIQKTIQAIESQNNTGTAHAVAPGLLIFADSTASEGNIEKLVSRALRQYMANIYGNATPSTRKKFRSLMEQSKTMPVSKFSELAKSSLSKKEYRQFIKLYGALKDAQTLLRKRDKKAVVKTYARFVDMSGEAEAREAQRRRDLGAGERRAEMPDFYRLNPEYGNRPLHQIRNEDSTETYYQAIGVDGARRLDAAEGVTTRMDNLKIARSMERAGMPVKKMWLATGWMRGADGKWRYEIMDGKVIHGRLKEAAKYSKELHALEDVLQRQYINDPNFTPTPEQEKQLDELEKLADVKLSDIFDAPELYSAYPDMRNVLIWLGDMKDVYAMYYADADAIEINDSGDGLKSKRELRKSIIHEIQHAIQTREGFAAGYGYSLKRDTTYKRLLRKFQTIIKRLDSVTRNKILGILDARANRDNAKAQALTTALSENELDSLNKINDVLGKMKERDDYLFSKYQRHAGETETRNMETRAYWSEARRKRTPLDASEDTPRSEQIIGRPYPRTSTRAEQAETFRQPLNNDVDPDARISVVRGEPIMPRVQAWQRKKSFSRQMHSDIISRFLDGKVINKHTGLIVTLSEKGLDHIINSARNSGDDPAGRTLYQAVPYLDRLVREAYRVETHEDRKPSATKIEGQKGNLKQVHRFLVPVDFGDGLHVLKLTAKEYDTGMAEIDEVSLYDMKHAKKLPHLPIPNSPDLTG